MAKTVLKFKTLILSDVHLGTPECKIDEVNFVLKHCEADKMILNGDIIDGWSLLRKGGWQKGHTRFVRLVLKKLEKKNTEVIYLRGNHDDVLRRFLPVALNNLRIVEEHIHESVKGNRYLVVHGDVFDVITQHHKFLAVLGHVGYQSLLKLNRLYNRYRDWRGKPYFSLSKAIKARVKNAVNYISSFEEELQKLARKRGCVGIICGHIHTPADKQVGDIHYLNSGDWVESMTALVEHKDGSFEILGYEDFRALLKEKVLAKARKERERQNRPVPAIASV